MTSGASKMLSRAMARSLGWQNGYGQETEMGSCWLEPQAKRAMHHCTGAPDLSMGRTCIPSLIFKLTGHTGMLLEPLQDIINDLFHSTVSITKEPVLSICSMNTPP